MNEREEVTRCFCKRKESRLPHTSSAIYVIRNGKTLPDVRICGQNVGGTSAIPGFAIQFTAPFINTDVKLYLTLFMNHVFIKKSY